METYPQTKTTVGQLAEGDIIQVDSRAPRLIEYPDALEITEIAEWSEGYCLTVAGHADVGAMVLSAADVHVSDERGTVPGWDIHPVVAGETVLGQPVGTAIPPEGDSADCWLDCPDVFDAESVRVLGHWLAS